MKNNKILKFRKNISRRTFISRTATGTAFMAFGPVSNLVGGDLQQDLSWPPDVSAYRFHMIAHAHIDPVWLWPWQEGISLVHSTFRSALDRMNETTDFTFTASSAQFYQWIAENDPSMLAEIRKRVNEGRWNIVGGWWVEPDVNIPCGESLVRQGLYGQLTLQRLLGHRAKVAFNPDSFGHPGTLPQIIKLQGMENYIFMRPAPREKSLPSDLFWWEGPDGTRVLTYRIQISYNDGGSVKNRVKNILTQSAGQPFNTFMAYYGAGDHGGGATRENIRSIEELKSEKGSPVVFYSTPDHYFREVNAEKDMKLPVVKDDLQHHAVGCYTAESAIKKGNRHSETALITAEKLTSVGALAWGASYPGNDFTTAWQKVLFLQFHDSMAGTSVPEHSEAARDGFGHALDIARQASWLALQKLEWQVPAVDPASQYLVIFNPHTWEVHGRTEYDLSWDLRNPSVVLDEHDNPLPHQWIAGSTETGSRRRLVVSTKLPAFGYRQIRLTKGEAEKTGDIVTAEGNRLENSLLKVNISKSGTIGVIDKENGREVFAGGMTGCKAVIIDDPSDTWSHEVKSFSNETGAFANAEIKVTENGPLRATIRTITTYGASKLIIDWTLWTGSGNLEARVTLDWHEHLKMLKFSFPVDVESPVATYETPYGHIIRATNGNEDPGQRWIDLNGRNNGTAFGLAVINDAKYGYSVHENDMRITVARSAVYAHHIPRKLDMKSEHLWMDQGIQTFRMLIVPHRDTWQKRGIARIAEEFMSPPLVIYQGIHPGKMPQSQSFMTIDAQNIIVSAIKQAETGEDIIIRCVETSGLPATAGIDLRFADRKWSGTFRPFEIKTLRMNRKTGEIREVTLLEE